MYRLLALSDSHGDSSAIRAAVTMAEGIGRIDGIAFMGDGARDICTIQALSTAPIYAVSGNCDFASDSPRERIEIFGDTRAFITHGHSYGVKQSMERLYWRARELNAPLVLYGHTHIADVHPDNGAIFVNPGHCSYSRGSFAIIEIGKERGIIPRIYLL